MAITLLQSNNATGSGVSFPFTITGSTAASLIVVGVHNSAGVSTANTCSDGTNGTYNKDNESLAASRNLDLFTFPGNAGGTLTVTVGAGGASPTYRVAWAEWGGIVTSSALDQTQVGSGTSTSASSGATATTTQAVELAIGLVGEVSSNSTTPGGGYALDQNDASPRIGLSHLILAATGAQTATFTLGGSTNWGCIVATYKAIVSSGPQNQLMMTRRYVPIIESR